VLIRLHALIRHFSLIDKVKQEYVEKGAYITREINQEQAFNIKLEDRYAQDQKA